MTRRLPSTHKDFKSDSKRLLNMLSIKIALPFRTICDFKEIHVMFKSFQKVFTLKTYKLLDNISISLLWEDNNYHHRRCGHSCFLHFLAFFLLFIVSLSHDISKLQGASGSIIQFAIVVIDVIIFNIKASHAKWRNSDQSGSPWNLNIIKFVTYPAFIKL